MPHPRPPDPASARILAPGSERRLGIRVCPGIATLLATLLAAVPMWWGVPARAERVRLSGQVVAVDIVGVDDASRAEAVRASFGIAPGDALSEPQVRIGIQRVFQTGPWADVRVFGEEAAGGWRVRIEVDPEPLVREARLALSEPVLHPHLAPIVGVLPGEVWSEALEASARTQLLERLRDLGYPRAGVITERQALAGGAWALTFRVQSGPPTLLRVLQVEGNPMLSRADIEDLLGARVGAPFDRIKLDAGMSALCARLHARRHLRATCRTEAIAYESERDEVRIRVRLEAGPRYRVVFRGNRLVPTAYLRTLVDERRIGALPETELSAEAIRSAQRSLEQLYLAHGYAHARVAVDDVPVSGRMRADADRALRVTIEEGPRVELAEIWVEGSTTFDGAELEEQLWEWTEAELPDEEWTLRPTPDPPIPEAWSSFAPKRNATAPEARTQRPARPLRYVASVMTAAQRYLADRFRQAGFLDVQIDGPLPVWLDEGRRVRLRYRVIEGPQSLIGSVRFDPPPSVALGDLLRDAAFRPGEPVDLYAIEQTRRSIESQLREQGFPFARVTESLRPLPAGRAIDVVFEVEQGPALRIGQLRVRGNRVTRDFVILDRVTLRSGQGYAASELERSRQRLLRTGLFSSVNVTLAEEASVDDARDVWIEVRERHRYSVEAGVGGSLEDGPRAFGTAEARNLMGLGLNLRGRAQVNYPRLLYDFVYDAEDPTSPLRRFDALPENARWFLFTEGQLVLTAELPKLYGLPLDARVHADVVGLREIRPTFTLMKASVLGGVDAELTSRWRLQPQLEWETSDFDCLRFGAGCREALTRRYNDSGRLEQVTLRALQSWGPRPDPFQPHEGLLLTLASDLALGSAHLRSSPDPSERIGTRSANFLKLSGSAASATKLAPFMTWALTLRGGAIFPLDGEATYVPPYKSFFLGGTSTVRGFWEDAILPSDHPSWPAEERDPRPAGDAGVVNQGGRAFANLRSELRLRGLGDLEFATFVDAGQLARDPLALRLAGWAIGSGVGVRYPTPVGPIALDLAWKVIDGQRRLPPLLEPSRMNLHISVGYP